MQNQQLEEARAQRELGYLNNASRLFDLALADDPNNLLLVMEAAGNKTSQRLFADAHAMLLAQHDRMEGVTRDLDPLHVAMFDIFMAFSTITMTAKFNEPLRCALRCYATYCMDKPVESFSKHVVSYFPKVVAPLF